jgi:hypothetical protein
VAGTLQSVDGKASKLTVTDSNKQAVPVTTTNTTKITKIADAKVEEVGAGAVVAVHGTASGTNGIAADQIAILPSGTNPAGKPGRGAAALQRAGVAFGTADGAKGGTFTVTESDGTKVTVTTLPSTKVVKATTAALGDLAVGKPIAVEGTPNADGSITATGIQQNLSSVTSGPGRFGFGGFGPRGPGHGGRFGTPDSDDGSSGSGSATAPAPASSGTA